jgi:hypothetical protein
MGEFWERRRGLMVLARKDIFRQRVLNGRGEERGRDVAPP